MRYILFGNIGLISRVIDNDASVLHRIVHPFLQPLFIRCRSGGIIRETQINDIRCFFRRGGDEAVFFCTGHVDDSCIASRRRIVFSGTSRHYVGVKVDRIDRVADRDDILRAEQFLNIGGVRFRAVRNKDLVSTDLAAPCAVIIFRDGFPEERIPEIRCVSAESRNVSHLVDRAVQCFDHGIRQRLRHIADSEGDNAAARVSLLIGSDFFCDRGKQIASLQFLIICVYGIHVFLSFTDGSDITCPAPYRIRLAVIYRVRGNSPAGREEDLCRFREAPCPGGIPPPSENTSPFHPAHTRTRRFL